MTMMMKKTAAILSLFLWPAASEVLVLTVENYEAATMGKSVFLKVSEKSPETMPLLAFQPKHDTLVSPH
jgi:hypothetical protein